MGLMVDIYWCGMFGFGIWQDILDENNNLEIMTWE